MKTFTITLSDYDLELLESLTKTRVYQNLTEEQIVRNVLCVAMYEESKLYSKLTEVSNEETI